MQRAEVRSLQSQLDQHDVAADVQVVQLAVHVRERPGVVLDLLGELVGAAPGDADGLVGERAVIGESPDPSLEVFVFGDLVGLPDDLLVVQGHVVLLTLRPDGYSLAARQVKDRHRNPVICHTGQHKTESNLGTSSRTSMAARTYWVTPFSPLAGLHRSVGGPAPRSSPWTTGSPPSIVFTARALLAASHGLVQIRFALIREGAGIE